MKIHKIKPLIGYKCFSGSTNEIKSRKSKFKKALRTIFYSDSWRTIKDTFDACLALFCIIVVGTFCYIVGAAVWFWCLVLLAKLTDYLI